MRYITPKSQNRRRHKNMQTINCHWENIFKFRFSNSTQYINYSVFLCANIFDFAFYNYSILDFFNVKMTTEIKNIFGQENDAVTAQTGRQTVVKLLGILGRFHGCQLSRWNSAFSGGLTSSFTGDYPPLCSHVSSWITVMKCYVSLLTQQEFN